MPGFKSRICLLTACVLLFLSGIARADRAGDREEIHALLWRYARALDTLDAEAYAAVFTPDGEFGSGSTAARGTADLKEMILAVRKGREERAAAGEAVPPMLHMTTDSWIEFVDDDHARHHSYWLTVFGAVEGAPVNVAAAGRGVDELVRIDGQWLISSRDVAPQD